MILTAVSCLLLLSLKLVTCVPVEQDEYVYPNDAEYDEEAYNDGQEEMSEEKIISTKPVLIKSEKIHVVVDQEQLIRLPCMVDNPDHIQIIWSHIVPGQPKAQIAIGEKVLTSRASVKERQGSSTLIIAQAKDSDSGEYVCEVATGGAEIPSLVHTVTVRDGGATIVEPHAEPMSSAAKLAPLATLLLLLLL